MKFVKYLLGLLAPIVLCACPGEEDYVPMTIPTPTSIIFEANELEKSLAIQSNEDWKITENDDWLSVSEQNHKALSKEFAKVSVKISVSPNPTDSDRTGTLILNGLQSGKSDTISVRQKANEHVQYYTYVTTPDFSVGHEAGSFSLNIQSNEPWQLTTESVWCIPSVKQGEGNSMVEISVDVNGNTTERKAIINIKGVYSGATAQVIVTQSGAPMVQHISIAEFLQKADTKNAYELTGTVKNITNTTYGNFDLVENGSKIFIYGLLDKNSEAKNFSSMNIEDGDELTLSGVYFVYDNQPEIMNAQFVSLKKHQKPLALSSETLAVGSGASTTQFGISSAESWTVTSSQSWCTVSPKSGSNDATVTVSVEKNTTKDKRTATITVKGEKSGAKSIVLTQNVKNGSSNFGKDEYGDDSSIDGGITYTLSATPLSLIFTASGSSKNVAVSGNDSWTASSSASWCTLSKTSGTGGATIAVSASKNSTTSPRTATIIIKGSKTGKTITISVSQEKGNSSTIGKDEYGDDSSIDGSITYTLSATPSSLSFTAPGSNKNVTVSGNDSWTASSSASWCTLSKTSGTGAATIAVTASKNSTTSPRTATITIKGSKTGKTITISVSQEKGNSSTIGKDEYGDDSSIDGSITYTLSATPSSLSFTASGGGKNVTVSGNDSWTASSSASWCTLSKTSGTGGATIAVSASKNSTTSPRTATITIKGSKTGKTITISVSQEKGNSSTIGKDEYGDDSDIDGSITYTLSATPSSLSFTASGSSKNVTVSGNDSWTASSSASWCTLSKTSGTGAATIAVTASKNSTTSPRTATITIKGSKTGKTITISVSQEKGNSSTVGKDEYDDDSDIDGSKETGGTVIGKGEFE